MTPEVRKKNRSTSYLTLFLLLLILVLAVIFLLPAFRQYQRRKLELSQVTAELNDRKEESSALRNEANALRSSPEAIEKVAREKFGMVKEGEKVLKYDPPASKESRKKK